MAAKWKQCANKPATARQCLNLWNIKADVKSYNTSIIANGFNCNCKCYDWEILCHFFKIMQNIKKTRYTFCSTERGFLPHCSCVYCAELVIDLAKISLGLHLIEHLWLLLAIKRDFYGILSHIFTAHAQKRPEYYFRCQIWPRHSIRHARKPIRLWNCGWKR